MKDFEESIAFLGQWGFFQKTVFFVLCASIIPNGSGVLSIIFVADIPHHHCVIPEVNLTREWLSVIIPVEVSHHVDRLGWSQRNVSREPSVWLQGLRLGQDGNDGSPLPPVWWKQNVSQSKDLVTAVYENWNKTWSHSGTCLRTTAGSDSTTTQTSTHWVTAYLNIYTWFIYSAVHWGHRFQSQPSFGSIVWIDGQESHANLIANVNL